KPYGGIYDTHDRDPAFNLVASMNEAIETGRKAGVPVKIAHVKVVASQAGAFEAVRKLINDARSRGEMVTTDQYTHDGAVVSELWKIIALPDHLRPKSKEQRNRAWVAGLLSDAKTRA